ncbi:MAG TPA: Holliday junction branch migration protein RuvA [Candidatus Gracilibacteria bacterium]|nr:Holliday junction branch migration protein RuvA [Candidatus Gracilibacteria bacterium]
MIGYLKGTVLKKTGRNVILDTGNVGYLVGVNENLLMSLNEQDEVELFAYTHVREDAIEIFGFESFDELEFFKQLISISGVGPKTAQDILSMPIGKVKNAIINEDSKLLSSVPRVGKKIADRIILELKNKVAILDSERIHKELSNNNINDDIIGALEKLGYNKKQIEKVLINLPKEITSSEEIIKFFLKNA